MLFSFVVPVYNTSKYLDKCMESILCQKGAEYEIVLVDDGSTDGSSELCDIYEKKYPDIVKAIHKHNEGLLLTRRRGFKEAKGDWLLCCDSDDYINEHLLESVVSIIKLFSPDLVMYNFEYFDDYGEQSKSRLNLSNESVYQSEEKQLIYRQRLLTDDVNSMCMKAIKREILDMDSDYSQCGIRNMCEDAIQVLPIFTNASRIVYLNKPLYYYRKGQDSITAARTYDNWLALKTCFLITEDYLDIWNVSDELKSRFYTHSAENLSNFLRWANSQPDDKLEKTFNEIIYTISTHPAYKRCMERYSKSYAGTSYLRFSVPKIMKYVKKANANGLKRFLAFEKKIRSKRKG